MEAFISATSQMVDFTDKIETPRSHVPSHRHLLQLSAIGDTQTELSTVTGTAGLECGKITPTRHKTTRLIRLLQSI